MEPPFGAHATAVERTNRQKTEGDWYSRSWIHSHTSINPPVADLEFVVHQLQEVAPDAVQFHCTGGPKLWEAVRQARLEKFPGLKLVATINAAGTWRDRYDNDPAFVYRVHPDGRFAGRWERKHLCFNSPGVREHLIPEKYRDLPARLQPDQVWIDENIITVNLCWCENCTRLYREQYHTEPPTQLTADNHAEWTQWTTFHRKSFERWMRDVYDAVNSACPGTPVTFNHAWFVEQPETPPPYLRNLSADIHKDPLELGLYARYGGSGAIPFDLMPGLGDDIWAGVHPKKLARVLNDVASIVAHGGRWNIGEFPTNYTSVRKEPRYRGNGRRPADVYLELARQGAEFARHRQRFCQHTKPVPHVVLLHSASTHYDHVIQNVNGAGGAGGFGKTSDGTSRQNQPGKLNSRVYWPNNNPIDDSLVGAYEALLENHVHFNFTIEDRLAQDLQQAALLVLAEQHLLDPGSVASLKTYVYNGGRVLATGSTRQAGMDELFDYESESPKRFGKGQTIYLPADFFRQYAQCSGYSRRPKGDAADLRKRAARIFKTLLPADPYTFDAPPWFEWTLRRSADGEDLLINIINRELDWSLPTDPWAKPLRCSLELAEPPQTVTLEPGGESVEWSFGEGRLRIAVDPGAVPHHRVLRLTRTTDEDREDWRGPH